VDKFSKILKFKVYIFDLEIGDFKLGDYGLKNDGPHFWISKVWHLLKNKLSVTLLKQKKELSVTLKVYLSQQI